MKKLDKMTLANAFALAIAIASFLRLYELGIVPVGMTDDEIRLAYSGYSIAHSGILAPL